MKSHAGLTKKVISVKGKKGIVKRSYWVRAGEKAKAAGRAIKGAAKSTGRFLGRHKGKIAAAAAVTGAYLAVRGAQHVKKTHIGFQQAGRKGTARDYAKAAWIGMKSAPGRDARKVRDAAKGAAASVAGTKGYKAAAGAARRASNYVSSSRVGKAASSAGSRVAKGASSAAGAVRNAASTAGSKVSRAGRVAKSAVTNVAASAKRSASTKRQTTKYSGKNRRLQLGAG